MWLEFNGEDHMASSISEVIKTRRSIKKYSEEEISKEMLSSILEACQWAPSAHNAQPWRFIVVRDHLHKQNLAKNMAVRWEEDLSGDGIPKAERKRLIEDSVMQFSGSPIVIIACLTMKDMDQYPNEQRRNAEHIMGVQSVAAAIENLLLAAHDVGLGACWFCAPLFCPDAVRETLRIPKHMEPQALITLGYPSKQPNPPARRALTTIVYEEYWGTPT
ncbi:MAG: hypothetical protein QG670_305 [Thermoproteota archaeon]|nr:hypothetical protein [Thermoproteota archaeon]